MAFLVLTSSAHAGALETIKSTQALTCGVITEQNDETVDDTHGDLSNFGTDICRAVGAAILGAHPKVAIHAYPSENLAYKALQSNQIALIVGATPNPGIARTFGVAYLTPVFFDTQGLLVHKNQGIASLRDLAGKHVCFIGSDTMQPGLDRAARTANITLIPFPFEEIGEMEAALVGGRCDAETHDISKLAAGRAAFHGRIHDFTILPDRLSLDPFSPVVRNDDPAWARAVDAVTGALVQAEISGVTQANADAMRANPDPAVQTLTGARRGPQWGVSLPDDWSLRAIKAGGNYAEIYNRDIGEQSPLRLDRGLNQPWVQGGMLWGLPLR